MKKRGEGQFPEGFRSGLAKEAEGMHPEDRDLVESALRVHGTGYTGPLNAMDADVIERTHSMHSRLTDYGFSSSLLGSKSPRGVKLDIGTEHQIAITPNSGPGYHVQIDHPARYDTTESGEYKHPTGWGEHSASLHVDEQDLPGALVEHFANPEVRRKAALD
jgi:hypothetical protein